jgi:hypothetical protein
VSFARRPGIRLDAIQVNANIRFRKPLVKQRGVQWLVSSLISKRARSIQTPTLLRCFVK